MGLRPLAFGLLLSCGSLTACSALSAQSGPARAQEAASDLNLNTRFGRMEIANEFVAPSAREQFAEHHKAWGSRIRVADYEMAGLKMKGSSDAEVFVRVAWFRVDEGDLRATTLKQSWHESKGDWQLTDEAHVEGDVGLLGEPMPEREKAPPGAQRGPQFPTIRLGDKPSE